MHLKTQKVAKWDLHIKKYFFANGLNWDLIHSDLNFSTQPKVFKPKLAPSLNKNFNLPCFCIQHIWRPPCGHAQPQRAAFFFCRAGRRRRRSCGSCRSPTGVLSGAPVVRPALDATLGDVEEGGPNVLAGVKSETFLKKTKCIFGPKCSFYLFVLTNDNDSCFSYDIAGEFLDNFR